MQLELRQLHIEGGTQPREKINEEAVAEYAAALRAGDTFPPVVAFHDGVVYWLADGFHRYHAHRRAGLDTIEVDVKEGTLREAMLYSVGANTDHGLRRTNEDKRKAVLTMLTNEAVAKDDEGKPWSDREIARLCKVHWDTVGKYRASLSETDSEKKASNDAAISNETTGSRVYTTKHGTRATMNTANIGKPKVKGRKKVGGIAPGASKPVIGHSKIAPRAALELPYDPHYAAKALVSVFGEEFIRHLIVQLNACLKGASHDAATDTVG